jgi:diguanylate cyclase
MLNVLYTCIAHKHDFRLVFLAAVVCVLGCITATNLLLRARAALGNRRTALLVGADAVFGTGVWATLRR